MLQGYAMHSPTSPPRRDLDPDNIHTATGQAYRVLIIEDDVELGRCPELSCRFESVVVKIMRLFSSCCRCVAAHW